MQQNLSLLSNMSQPFFFTVTSQAFTANIKELLLQPLQHTRGYSPSSGRWPPPWQICLGQFYSSHFPSCKTLDHPIHKLQSTHPWEFKHLLSGGGSGKQGFLLTAIPFAPVCH